jgi:Ca2+-binding RTX toxin-like protein
MAKTTATGAGSQVVGKVFVLYGTVKAVATDGTVRVLTPNSPIYADDRIITGADGSISIKFDGPPVTQLDLGRMTEIVIDEDVYGGVSPEVATEAAADAEKIQEALLAGDEEIDLEATAAGGDAGAGGGHSVVVFDLDGNEVTPGSGADTTGITTSTVYPISGVLAEAPAAPPEAPPEPEPEPVIPPPEPTFFAAAVTPPPTTPEIPTIPEIPDEPEPVTGKVTLTAAIEPVDAEPEQLPYAISHVLFIVEGDYGTIAVKIDGYDGEINDPGHPAGYIDWIEGEYNGEVTAYYIKAGSEQSGGQGNNLQGGEKPPGGFFTEDGVNITDKVQAPDDGQYDDLYQYLTNNEQSFGGNNVEDANDPEWVQPEAEIDSYNVTVTATVDNPPPEGSELELNLVDDNGNPYTVTIDNTGSGSVTFSVSPEELEGEDYLKIEIDDYEDGGYYDELNTDSTVLIGGPGDDTLTGADGDDFILGGTGDDTIDGGPGEDTIFGGAGDDTIEAKDGEADTIGEGAGDSISYDDVGTPPLDTLVPDPDDPTT